ncbi:immunoglobulin-like domain-containing protein [uncultured Aquimarina sp.]|uniref:immunoglobulin-like domain-containing protein n=1 Tax=uncultured Aquimarina sp. TaxID=575652 RepID=UPI00262A2448|nr:immunoglobulin-like domain-containing protein [uncultured Aquimarina sp.]
MKHNYYRFIKNLTLALALVSGLISVQAQDITFTFANAQNTNDGMDDFYEVDVLIESTVDFKLGSGQLYLNYNTAAFGTNVSAGGNLEYTQPNGYILGEVYGFPAYTSFIQNDNTTSRVSLSFQQGVSSGTITAENVTGTPKLLFHVKIKYADIAQDPMVTFETGAVFLDQFFTACGPAAFGFPDCTNNPGTQLFNDTFDSSGGVIDVIPPVIMLTGANPQTIELGAGYTELGATTDDGSAVVIDDSAFVDAVGSYSVTYNATDGSGNNAVEVIRTVNVVDTTAPIISLTGANPQTIELGAGYSELGATTDDGSAVVIDDSAFVDAIGSYSVTYNATDASGNNAVEVVRTVNVVDTTAPVISLTGANPQTIELGAGYSELGATTDDGSAVVIDDSAFVDAVGSYSVTYNATDASGNDAVEVVRTVNVVDTTAPIISLTGANPQTIERTNSYTELGATTDDGSAVVIDASAVDINTAGSYSVTYNAMDASGNNAIEVIRTVNVVDTTAPVISLTGANPQTIELGAGYTELGATTDDGSAVVIDDSAFVDAVGSYSVTYNATDASGNNAVEVVRTVNVVDTTAPIISLTGANPQTIELGAGYSELGATTDDGSAVVIDDSAFVDAVGSYSVTYNATDASGNNAVEVVRTVNVVDTTAPIISLTGANPQTIERTNSYTELGATTDDGSAVVIDASAVDINIAGSYSVTYNAMDASGNNAIEVVRTVTVVDTTVPVISLTGANPQTIELGAGYSELGATTDDGSAIVIDDSAFVDAVGSYSVTYNATDASGNNAVEVVRTVNVVDTTAPIISLTGANPQTIELGAGYSELGATTNDGSAVVIDDSAFVDAVGSYSVTYNATDASGNNAVEVVRTVNVVDTTAPVISLTGANPQEIVEGTSYVELGATTDDGSAVVIDASAVNTNTVGSYSVTYNAMDASGNNAIEVTRTVNVVPLLSIDDNELALIKLYPNPVSDRFVISGISETVDSVEIYNMQGRLVKHISSYGSETINVAQLQEGVYMVRITAGTAVKTMQFVKKR